MDIKHQGKKIFLSYSKEDKKIAHAIYYELREQGCEVFWDQDIRPGESWDDVIQKSLNASDYVIILLSNSYFKSSYNFGLSEEFSIRCKQRNINTFCLNFEEDYPKIFKEKFDLLNQRDIQLFD